MCFGFWFLVFVGLASIAPRSLLITPCSSIAHRSLLILSF
jgi:hypothetical protein